MEDVIQAILNVMTIIALIAAVAFIIILIVDLVLSITNRQGSIFFRGNCSDKTARPEVKDTKDDEIVVRPTVLEEDKPQTWNEEEARNEQLQIMNKGIVDEEEELRRAKEKDLLDQERQDAIDTKKKEFDDFDDFDSLFSEENEVVAPVEEAKEEVETEFNFDELINEINNEAVATYDENKAPAEVEETKEEVADLEEETEEVKTEEASASTDETVVAVKAEPEEVKKEIVNVYEYFPMEALNARLEKLEERLKVNERDLKGNRKEYNPLARVERSLKRDQEKLRRREAVIARKKVLLYGVNNYVDIDEEKAKKLSEDLDLLDGLRLSVQHCEEVMEQNKDRFPILAKTNEILVAQNKQIKEDIAEVKAAIEKLSEGNKENNETNDEE